VIPIEKKKVKMPQVEFDLKAIRKIKERKKKVGTSGPKKAG